MTSEITKTEKPMVLFSIFYIVAGIALLGYFAMEISAAPLHIPVLGIISLITAFTVFKMKKWALPLVAGLLVTGLTFGATTLSNSLALQTFGDAMLLNIALIAYMIILLIASLYILAKRETFN